jgi:penicillin-binding protein 1A
MSAARAVALVCFALVANQPVAAQTATDSTSPERVTAFLYQILDVVLRAELSQNLPDVSSLGDQLRAELAKKSQDFVPFADMPSFLVNAFVAAEDPHLYSRTKADPFNDRSFSRRLALNTRPAVKRADDRIYVEMLVEEKVLATFSKEQIIEIYLNAVTQGSYIFGVGQATRAYFGKSVPMLELHEAAYLAALAYQHWRYHPLRNAGAALERRNAVLRAMVEQGYVDRDAADDAMSKPLVTLPTANDVR